MKIFTATPKPFLKNNETDDSFFSRDMGLTCHLLRDQKVESMVVMPDAEDAKAHPDIIRTSLQNMESAEWWRSLRMDAVVLGAWAHPKYTPIAKAIHESGAKLLIRCDNGFEYSAWQSNPFRFIYMSYLGFRYKGSRFMVSCLLSAIKSTIYYIPWVYEARVVKHMSYADLIMNETPAGVRCLKAMLHRYRRIDIASRVRYVLHPISSDMGFSQEAKKRKIIAVGRWEDYQKNAELMMRSIAPVLESHTEYEFHVFGGGEKHLQTLKDQLPSSVQPNIVIHGPVSHDRLAKEYRESRIMFMPSRSEGSSVAAEEALACGCSIVGSAHIFSMQNFVSKNSGTLARTYRMKSMILALKTEIEAWDAGLRSPLDISTRWRSECGGETIAKEVIRCV